MDIQTIISVLGLLGVGGIIGGYLQHLWSQKRETESRIQTLNEDKYRSDLVVMRCILNPGNLNHYSIKDPNVYKLKSDNEVKEYEKKALTEIYYNSLLYASDDVLKNMKKFMENPTETNFMETAISMRKDLWKKGTKVDLKTLSLKL